jgi:hypothetical protein
MRTAQGREQVSGDNQHDADGDPQRALCYPPAALKACDDG